MNCFTKESFNRKRILIIINELRVGGAQKVVINDIKLILEQGHEIALLTFLPEIEGNTLVDQLGGVPIQRKFIHFKKMYELKAWIKTIQFIKEFKPDVLVTHLWFSNTVGRIAGLIAGVKNVISFEHNVYDSVKPIRHYLIDRVLQFCTKRIIAVSSAVKSSLIQNGISEKRVSVLLNTVDVNKFESADRTSRISLGLSDDDFVYIFIGRLVEQKAVDILIEAFSKDVDGRLLIVGDGFLRNNLEDLTRQLGIQEKVHFLGLRTDIPELLKTSDCFILPSRYEGVGIVVLEAFASGVPVIVSDFPAGRDFLENETNALVVPINDVSSLRDAMQRIHNEATLRDKLVKSSRLLIEDLSQEKRIDILSEWL